ncbi:unnamed protein product [Lota lota]
MTSRYPELSRLSRKLNFLPNKERSHKQWGRTVTLEDADGLFDSPDSSSDGFNGIKPLSPMANTSFGAKENEEVEASSGQQKAPLSGNIQRPLMGPKGVVRPPAEPLKNTEQNLEASIPFVQHCPIKTSSPLEGKHVDRRVKAVSPIPFLGDDEEVSEEEPKTARPSMARAQSKGPIQSPQRQASSEQLVSVWRPEPQLPSTSGSRQPAAVKKCHTSSFIQKLQEARHFKAPWRSPLKEPAPPQEPEEEFVIEDPPARITIPRKKFPSTYQQKGPNAQQMRNNSLQSSADQGLKLDPTQKAETQAPGHGGERAGLEEGRAVDKKEKKEKAAIPSLPSPKKSSVKRAKSKGVQIPTEVDQQEPSREVADRGEESKQSRKKVTKESMPSPSRPQVQAPRHTSPSQAVSLKDKEQSSTLVPKRSKSTKGPQQEVKEKKTGKPVKRVKGRQREEMLSEPSHSITQEEQSFNMGSSIPEMGGPLTSEEALLQRSGSLLDSGHVPGSRKRPGECWLSSPSSPEEPGGPPALKVPKQDPRRPEPGAGQATQDGALEEKNTCMSPSTNHTARGKVLRKARKTTNKRGATGKMVKRGVVAGVMEKIQSSEVQQVPDQVLDPGALSPEDSSSRPERLSPSRRMVETYQHVSPSGQTSGAASIQGAPEPAADRQTRGTSRTRKSPGEWWVVGDAVPDADILPPSPPQKERKAGRPQSKQEKPLAPPTPPRAPSTASTAGSKPLKPGEIFPAPKTVKRSLATFQDILSRTAEVSPPAPREQAEGGKRSRRKRLLASLPDHRLRDPDAGTRAFQNALDALNSSGAPLNIEAPANSCSTRLSWPSNMAPPQPNKSLSASMVSGFQSGPSSPTHQEQHEHKSLPSTGPQLSYWTTLGLYAPPLRPMVLQSQDKANLEEWLSLLWPAHPQAPSNQMCSDDFEWFCHRGWAIGLQVDMCSDSMCNGKIILGSNMKKPLWVDHCAVTVFFITTSCVLLTMNAVDSHYNAGLSFVVPCGHAYSIKNLGDEPAVIFFSRVLKQSPE